MRSWLTLALVAVIAAVAMAGKGNGKGGNGAGAPAKGGNGPSFDDINCFKKRACKAVPKPQKRACKRHCRMVRRQSRPGRSLVWLFRQGLGIRKCHQQLSLICHRARGPHAAERCEQGAQRLEYAQQRAESLASKRLRLKTKRDEVCAAAEAAEEAPADVDLTALESNVNDSKTFLSDTTAEQTALVEVAEAAMIEDANIYFSVFYPERDACLASLDGPEPIQPTEELCLEVYYNATSDEAHTYGEPFTSLILNSRYAFFNATEDAEEAIAAAQADLDEAEQALAEAEAAAATEDPCGLHSLVRLQRQCRRLGRRVRKQQRRIRRYGSWVELLTNCFERACPDHAGAA